MDSLRTLYPITPYCKHLFPDSLWYRVRNCKYSASILPYSFILLGICIEANNIPEDESVQAPLLRSLNFRSAEYIELGLDKSARLRHLRSS